MKFSEMPSYGLLTASDFNTLGISPCCVYLNGSLVSNVLAVNDIEGWVDVIRINSDLLTAKESRTGDSDISANGTESGVVDVNSTSDDRYTIDRLRGQIIVLPKGEEIKCQSVRCFAMRSVRNDFVTNVRSSTQGQDSEGLESVISILNVSLDKESAKVLGFDTEMMIRVEMVR